MRVPADQPLPFSLVPNVHLGRLSSASHGPPSFHKCLFYAAPNSFPDLPAKGMSAACGTGLMAVLSSVVSDHEFTFALEKQHPRFLRLQSPLFSSVLRNCPPCFLAILTGQAVILGGSLPINLKFLNVTLQCPISPMKTSAIWTNVTLSIHAKEPPPVNGKVGEMEREAISDLTDTLERSHS